MEERKNNNVVIAVVITVLVMIVLGLVGFIVYDKVITKTDEPSTGEHNKVENNEQEKEEVVVDYNLSDAKKLVDKYYYNYRGMETTFQKMSENDKMFIAYTKLNESDFGTAKCEKLYAGNKNDAGGYYVDVLGNEYACNNDYSKTIAYDLINSAYQELFGSSVNIPKKSFAIGWEAVGYTQNTNEFVDLEFYGGGDWPEPQPKYEVLSAKLINDNELVVEVGYVVFTVDVERELYYADFDKNITYTDINKIEEDFFTKNADKVKVLKFNFTKENNKFVLNNMEA